MVIGIGTDIVEIARIERLFDKRGHAFAHRILSQTEWQALTISVHPRLLAKRWAAKEAVAKALGTGMAQGVCFQDISVTHTPAGQPLVRLTGQAQHIAEHLGIDQWHLSISDERAFAVAYVLAQSSNP